MPRTKKNTKKRFNTLLDEDLYIFLKDYSEARRMSMTQVLVNHILDLKQKEPAKDD